MYKPNIFGFNFSVEEIKLARKNASLLLLQIFTSPVCNFKCIYCYTDAENKPCNSLSFNDYQLIIDQAIKLGLKTVAISGEGEPLLDDQIFNIIDLNYKQNLVTILFTNGSIIDKDIAKYLWDRNVTAVIKMNSIDDNIQDELTSIKKSSFLIKRGLKYLIGQGFNGVNPTRLVIDSLICTINIKEIVNVFQFARNNNIEVIMELCKPFGKGDKEELQITKLQARDLFKYLAEIDRDKYNRIWTPSPPLVGMICDKLYYGMFVDTVGDVRPCTGIDIVLGNIKKIALRTIWDSPLMKKLRNMEKNDLEGKCGRCKYECYGCRARALLDSGNIFGEYKDCWN